MTGTGEFIVPGRLRLILTATLVVPSLFVILLLTGLDLRNPLFPVILAIIGAYLLACIIDYVIVSRTLKIAVASVAALVSVVIGSLLLRSMTMVCDPVHDPGIVCDPVHVPDTPTQVPTIISTIGPGDTPPMIFDPVHEPGSCSQLCSPSSSEPSQAVAAKLEECLRSCGR